MKESYGRCFRLEHSALPWPLISTAEEIQPHELSPFAVVAKPNAFHLDVDEPGQLEKLHDLVNLELHSVFRHCPRQHSR